MKKSWVLFVASRYIFKGRSSSPVLAVLGIAIGVLALTVIIAVMNGFQLGFIESILEVSSFHLRVENFDQKQLSRIQEIVLDIPGVKAAIPFREYQAIAKGKRMNQQAVLVRGLGEDALDLDRAMWAKLEFEEGYFDLSKNKNILLGSELAYRLNLSVGDDVTLYSLTGILSQEDGSSFDGQVTGIFRTGYYEYDCSWAFININSGSFLQNESDLILGVKLANRFMDKQALDQVKKRLSAYEGIKVSSWRDYNRSFFGALRTEKLFMFILVGLIFIVVGLNIFQAQRRSVLQRREEIGLLRAVGGSKNAVRFVFVLDGAIIGLAGAGIGMLFGLSIALNTSGFFTLIENIINGFIRIMNFFASLFGGGVSGNFAVFSPTIFYIKEIPSRILPFEVVLIFMFGFISAFAAAWFASRKVANIQPAEVLRYE